MRAYYTGTVLSLLVASPQCSSFTPSFRLPTKGQSHGVLLHMAKSKSLIKQADLRRKMELAKQQKEEEIVQLGLTLELTAQEIKERNDRLRFQELLKKEGGNVLNDYGSDGYLNKQQEEEEMTAARKYRKRDFQVDRIAFHQRFTIILRLGVSREGC